MPLDNKETSQVDRPVFEDGEVYLARVVQVVDLGLQAGGEYEGKPKPDKEQVLLTFEFPEVLNSEGNPGFLSVILDLPDHWENGGFKGMHTKSNMYKYMTILCPEGLWQGNSTSYYNFSRSFKFWDSLLDKVCQLEVKVYDKENNKASIVKGSITKLSNKIITSFPERISDPLSVNFSNITLDQWNRLYPWIRDKIKKSLDPRVQDLADTLNAALEKTKATEGKTEAKKGKNTKDVEDFEDAPY